MSPELKLIFMIISSATMFTVTKKLTKLDSNNTLASLFGNLMGGQQQQQQQPQQFNQQQKFQQQKFQQQQFNQQQQFPQPQFQQPQFQQPQQFQQQFDIPHASKLRKLQTESSDDEPSKLNGQDNIDLDNILKTMNQRKLEKESENDNVKDIPIQKKKSRGRPRKAN